MSTFRERRIDAASHPKELDIVPKLLELDAFKNQKPPTMNRLNPLISGLHQEDAWTIVDFLDKAPIGCITWEFNPTTEKVLHFGLFYRKIFRRIGKILYSYYKNHQFCGDVLSRMMVSQNLDVFHPYDGSLTFIRNLEVHFMKGMQTKNERIYNQNVSNRIENKKMKEINDELEYKEGHSSFSRLQNEPKMLPYLNDKEKF